MGYLTDDELVQFLQKSVKNLAGRADQGKRVASLESFVLVQDQVRPSEKHCVEVKGQRVRSSLEYAAIFKKAELNGYKAGEPEKVHKDFYPVMIWALW